MKKILILSVILSQFLWFGGLQAATTTSREGVGQRVANGSAAPTSTNKLDKRAENTARVAQVRVDRIRSYFERIYKKIQAAINREIKLADRIESRLNKFADAGKDVSALRTKLATARQAIKDAQAALDSAKSQITTVLAQNETPKEKFANVQKLLKDAVDKVKAAHAALVDVINSINGMGWTKESPKPSTSIAPSLSPTSSVNH